MKKSIMKKSIFSAVFTLTELRSGFQTQLNIEDENFFQKIDNRLKNLFSFVKNPSQVFGSPNAPLILL